MNLGIELKEKCKFKDVCKSILCDECDCLSCIIKCEFGNNSCLKDDTTKGGSYVGYK